ncbi:MAG: efflux RND transporter periplasmic adaptor subunit [Fluviicola sp.]|nr:efflux RND transporter periplasmic adaptor subunit [Fluviicola sp.]
MKKTISILTLLALVAIVIVQLLANKAVSENRIYYYDKEKAIIVQAQKIEFEQINHAYEFTGTFAANKDARINADVQGKIMKYYVSEGSEVVKGQMLVKIDDELLQLQLKTINVTIEGLETDVKRFTILSEADAVEAVKLEKVENGLKAAKIQKQILITKISKTTVRAPYKGIVTMKMSEIGSFASPGVPLLTLTDIAALKFTVNVSESDLELFQSGSSHKINADAFPSMDITGTVVSIGSKGNRGNSFPVQFEVNNKNLKIKSNMFGKVTLDRSNSGKSIVIPTSSIIGSDIAPKVYLIQDGKVSQHSITVVNRFNNKAVVGKGLKEGDLIVTSGFINLFDGANVIVNN